MTCHELVCAPYVTSDTVRDCAQLFSTCYGVWRTTGKHVKLSPTCLIRDFLFDNQCGVVVIRVEGVLVGQAFFRRFEMAPLGTVCWITQLVVHPYYRSQGLAKQLVTISSAQCHVVGIVSSHPFAVKSLGGSCELSFIQEWGVRLMEASQVPYLRAKRAFISDIASYVDTEFDIDHSEPQHALRIVRGVWNLGYQLPTGHEYLALVRFMH